MAKNDSSLILFPSSEKKKLIGRLETLYGVNLTFLKDYAFYITSKGKIYVFSGDQRLIQDLKRVSSMGLYFGTVHDNDRFRPSIEGSQLIRPVKNVIVLSEKNLKSYICAENLFVDELDNLEVSSDCPFPIIRYGDDFLGAMSIKEGVLLNYVAKGRRLDFNKVF